MQIKEKIADIIQDELAKLQDDNDEKLKEIVEKVFDEHLKDEKDKWGYKIKNGKLKIYYKNKLAIFFEPAPTGKLLKEIEKIVKENDKYEIKFSSDSFKVGEIYLVLDDYNLKSGNIIDGKLLKKVVDDIVNAVEYNMFMDEIYENLGAEISQTQGYKHFKYKILKRKIVIKCRDEKIEFEKVKE